MIIPKNDKEASSGMDVEKSLPPSGAVAVSEAEGSESSVSGDALFPTASDNNQWWQHSPKVQIQQDITAQPPSSDVVPFDSAQASLSDFYSNRPTNDDSPDTTSNNVAATSASIAESTGEQITIRTKRKRATGLGNLGNTCFMNSTLQCLAHTSPLREYFLSGEYKGNLNKDNPLGTGGELATEFAELLVKMWCMEETRNATTSEGVITSSRVYSPSTYDSTMSNVTYPRSFKHILGKYAQQFIGYDQHDSQELAIYLLDALHEDTNRITKKPYIEKPEQEEDETDDAAAQKAWSVHLQREDSKVFDYFMGQIKSRLQCTTKGCGRVSTTFDPSMYLSVPIPGSTDREMKITFVPLNRGSVCAEFTVKLCKNSTVTGLKKHVADLARECYGFNEGELLEEDIQFADVFQDRIYTYYGDDYHIDKIKDNDETYAYQLFPLASVKKEIAVYQKSQITTNEVKHPANKPTPDDFLLDSNHRSKLDENDEWQRRLENYIVNPHLSVSRLLNEKRSNLQERTNFHENMSRFVAKCLKCPDAKFAADDIIMEEKSDKADSLSTLNPNEAESADEVQRLAEVCEMSHIFRNINTANDLAILQYLTYKFKIFMHNVEQTSKQLDFSENGIIIDLALHKDGKRIGKPVVVRIPPTLTVNAFREMLAIEFHHVLKCDDITAGHPATETSIGGMSPQSSIMHQVAIVHEGRVKYGSGKITPFGSLTEEHITEGSSSFAKPCEDEEKEIISQFVEEEGAIRLHVPSRLNDFISEDTPFASKAWLSKAQKIEKEKIQDNKVSVLDCISKFCQAEQLDESDMWYCSKCKQHNQAWKECHLYRTPPILVIHLKRFHYSATTHRRDKIDTFIDFPLNDLDLRETVTHWKKGEEPIYDCYAVSNHFGGLGGGHYTAYARGDDNTWSNFDDSRVTPGVSESEVVSNAAYCLYYKRKDVTFNDINGVIEESPQACASIQTETGNKMELASPEFTPAPILSDRDDASSQAQMDVDDRSSGWPSPVSHSSDELNPPPVTFGEEPYLLQ